MPHSQRESDRLRPRRSGQALAAACASRVLAVRVQNADDLDLVGQNPIDHDVIRVHDQLTRAGDSAGAVQIGVFRQRRHGRLDEGLQFFGGNRIENAM
jgi:hypothetical protein